MNIQSDGQPSHRNRSFLDTQPKKKRNAFIAARGHRSNLCKFQSNFFFLVKTAACSVCWTKKLCWPTVRLEITGRGRRSAEVETVGTAKQNAPLRFPVAVRHSDFFHFFFFLLLSFWDKPVEKNPSFSKHISRYS